MKQIFLLILFCSLVFCEACKNTGNNPTDTTTKIDPGPLFVEFDFKDRDGKTTHYRLDSTNFTEVSAVAVKGSPPYTVLTGDGIVKGDIIRFSATVYSTTTGTFPVSVSGSKARFGVTINGDIYVAVSKGAVNVDEIASDASYMKGTFYAEMLNFEKLGYFGNVLNGTFCIK